MNALELVLLPFRVVDAPSSPSPSHQGSSSLSYYYCCYSLPWFPWNFLYKMMWTWHAKWILITQSNKCCNIDSDGSVLHQIWTCCVLKAWNWTSMNVVEIVKHWLRTYLMSSMAKSSANINKTDQPHAWLGIHTDNCKTGDVNIDQKQFLWFPNPVTETLNTNPCRQRSDK